MPTSLKFLRKKLAPKKKAAPKKKSAPQPKQEASKPKAKKAPRPRAASMAAAVDAREGTHVPPHVSAGPYTVLHTRKIVNVVTGATASEHFIFGAYRRENAPDTMCQFTSVQASSTTPLGQGYLQNDPVLVPYSTGQHSMRLHALTIEVVCTSQPLTVSGSILAGTLRSKVNLNTTTGGGTTYGDLFLDLEPRQELKAITTYAVTQKPVSFVSAPLDLVTWAEFRAVTQNGGEVADHRLTDGLMPILLRLPPGGLSFTITVHAEWCVMFANEPVLSATATNHKPTGQGMWHDVSERVAAAGGFVASALGAGLTMMRQVRAGAAAVESLRAPLLAL